LGWHNWYDGRGKRALAATPAAVAPKVQGGGKVKAAR